MQVSKWLGHESYVTTLTIYADYIDTEEGGKTPMARPVASTESTGTVVPFRPRTAG
jgi:integrase